MTENKRLNLANPISFGSRTAWYTKASVVGIALFAPIAPLMFMTIDGETIGYSIVGGMFAIAGALLFCSRAARTITATREGIESKSLVGRQYIPWGELLEITTFEQNPGFRDYTPVTSYNLRSPKAQMSFAESLQGANYLVSLCRAALNGEPDRDGLIHLEHIKPSTVQTAGPLVTPFMIAAAFIIAAGLALFVNAGAFSSRFVMPSAPVAQAEKYNGKDVRLSGNLHSDLSVSSRDGKYRFGLEVAEVDEGDSDSTNLLPMWAPVNAWLTDGTHKVAVKIQEPKTNNLKLVETGHLTKGWKQSKLANLLSGEFDNLIDEELQKLNDGRKTDEQLSPRIFVYAVLQDAPVTIAGHLSKIGDQLTLEPPPGGELWISAGAVKQFGDDSYSARWIGTAVVFMLWGVFGFFVSTRNYQNAKRTYQLT